MFDSGKKNVQTHFFGTVFFTFLPEKKEEMPGAEEDTTPDYVYVTVAIIATLVLFLSVGSAAAFKM